MARSLRVAILGFSCGFLLAGIWGLAQPGNHRLASMLFVPAGIGIAGLGVLVAIDAVRKRRWTDLEDVDGAAFIPTYGASLWSAQHAAADPAAPTPAAAAAAAAADAAAARIAELEARLAVEQQELDNVIHALDETAPLAPAVPATAPDHAERDSRAAEMEPLLRQEVLDTLVELVGRKADVYREFEALTTPGQAAVGPVERPEVAAEERPSPAKRAPASKRVAAAKRPPAAKARAPKQRAASEQVELPPVRRRGQRIKPNAPLDEGAQRVGKRDLRGGRARHTQKVGRADDDG
jgi:hypothetical protein